MSTVHLCLVPPQRRESDSRRLTREESDSPRLTREESDSPSLTREESSTRPDSPEKRVRLALTHQRRESDSPRLTREESPTHQETFVDAVVLLGLEVVQLLADRAAGTRLRLVAYGAVEAAVQVVRVLQAPVCGRKCDISGSSVRVIVRNYSEVMMF